MFGYLFVSGLVAFETKEQLLTVWDSDRLSCEEMEVTIRNEKLRSVLVNMLDVYESFTTIPTVHIYRVSCLSLPNVPPPEIMDCAMIHH